MTSGYVIIRQFRAVYTLIIFIEIICFLPRVVTSESKRFSLVEKQELINAHNAYRRAQGGANIRLMRWDDDLERMCLGFGDKCFGHSKPEEKTIEKYISAGENIHGLADDKLNLTSVVVDQWGEPEKKQYDFRARRCLGQMCGHYTQAVWWQSYALGCCFQPKEIECERYDDYSFVRCLYGPAGNVGFYRPFIKGKACSRCIPQEDQILYPHKDFHKFGECVCGLCSDEKLKEGCNPEVKESPKQVEAVKEGKGGPLATPDMMLVFLATCVSTKIF